MGAKHQVLVYRDHRNLLFVSKPQLLSAHQARWQEFFAGYDFKIFIAMVRQTVERIIYL